MGVTLLLLSLVAAAQMEALTGEISGSAVNGSADDEPLAGEIVILRVSQDGAFVVAAETTADARGRFRFPDLPADGSLIYLAGINRGGVHYPGSRIRLTPQRPAARVKLTGYDTFESPSPLVCRRHEIAVTPGLGFLEVAETLLIDNPQKRTYTGQKVNDRPPVTMRLSLPDGIEKVTFDREFHGRNFQFHEGKLLTEIPWPPGRRELKFVYRVPVERTYAIFERVLDQPTDRLSLKVAAKGETSLSCNLPQARPEGGGERTFASRGKPLPEGYRLTLRLGDVPLRFETYARWGAVAVLLALVAGSLAFYRMPRTPQTTSGPAAPGQRRPLGASRRSRLARLAR